jgi:hypothetical protein
MGWTTFHKPKNVSPKQYFEKEYGFGDRLELLAIETKSKVAYMAVRDKDKDYVFALVYLLTYAPKSYYNFGYKDMSEFAGPNVNKCPNKILKLLTPLEEIAKKDNEDITNSSYQWAMKWRIRCQEFNSKNKLNKIKNGFVVKLKEPLQFSSGFYYQYFQKIDKKTYAVMLDNNKAKIICRVRMNLNNFDYEIVENIN